MTNCKPSTFVVVLTYLNYFVIIAFGYIRDFYRRLMPIPGTPNNKPGFAPLLRSQDDFYTRRMFSRTSDCWSRPISSRPGAWIDVMLRDWDPVKRDWKVNGQIKNCLNLGSYNYLGFADNPKHVTSDVFTSLERYGTSTCSPMTEYGYTEVHRALELKVAEFLGKEAALCIGMGYATNSTIIPALAGPGTLIVSDSLNHASIVIGARSSGATIKVFKHNDLISLEKILRNAISTGMPRTHQRWKKVVILVEGVYSMEGEVANLKGIIELKKKYKCYLYVDEAHSIGAIGKTGRGVCELTGVSPADVDILMGTFTKSFGSVGGYVASSREVVEHLRNNGYSPMYGSSLTSACAQQVLSALRVIMGEDGTEIGRARLRQLRENSDYMRRRLMELGFEVIGDEGSPIVIIMIYNPGKVKAFSRLCLERNLAVVCVGAPATDLIESRVRICLSAAHSREDIDHALEVIDEVGDWTMTKYNTSLWTKLKQLMF